MAQTAFPATAIINVEAQKVLARLSDGTGPAEVVSLTDLMNAIAEALPNEEPAAPGVVWLDGATFKVSVGIPPTITDQPDDVTLSEGATATFSVTVSNAESYQWESQTSPEDEWLAVEGATESEYTTPALTADDNGVSYRCVATGPGGSVTSESATLTVVSPVIAGFRDSTPTSVSTKDYTASGVGVADLQSAAILFGNYATANGAATDNAGFALGFGVSPTNRLLAATRLKHGDTNRSLHFMSQQFVYGLAAVSTSINYDLNADFDSFIDGGVRLDFGKVRNYELFLHGLILQSAEVDLQIADVSLSEGGHVDLSFPFAPSGLILQGATDQYDDVDHPGIHIRSTGFVRRPTEGVATQQVCQAHNAGGSVESGNAFLTVFDNKALAFWDVSKDATIPDWEFEVEWLSETSVRIHTTKAGVENETPQIGVFAFHRPGKDVRVGIMDSPTLTGAQVPSFSNPVPFVPSATIWLVSQATAVNTNYVSHDLAGTDGVAIATGQGAWCATVSVENGVVPFNTQSLSDAIAFNVPQHDGSDGFRADLSAFVEGGVSLNVLKAMPAALKFPYMAFE